MKILVTPTSFKKKENSKARELLESFADEVIYNEVGHPLSSEEVISMLDDIDGYIAGVDTIDKAAIQAAPKSLKVISRYGAGFDRVDIDAANAKGITVTNTPGVNSIAVAELAFGLMLCAAREIPFAHNEVMAGKWVSKNGIELNGKTLGILGLGAIGKNLALRALAFHMSVIAYDPYMDKDFASAHGIKVGTLEEVLSSANFLSLHLPHNENTHHIIDERAISLLPEGAIIINTARGGLIDEDALLAALNSGHLRMACMDAFEKEPPQASPLFQSGKIIVTPHAGAHTAEAVCAMGLKAVENLIAVLTGKECKNIIK